MKTTIDYSKSPAPAFDAVEDIKNYLGKKKWDEVSPQMATVENPRQFEFYCMIAGIEGAPVRHWYDLYHGTGKFAERMVELENAELNKAS